MHSCLITSIKFAYARRVIASLLFNFSLSRIKKFKRYYIFQKICLFKEYNKINRKTIIEKLLIFLNFHNKIRNKIKIVNEQSIPTYP